MMLWVRSILAGAKGAPTAGFLLQHGGLLCWMPTDDLSFEHSAWFPRRGEGFEDWHVRHVFVFRWLKGVRSYSEETHKNTSGEKWDGQYEDFL